MSAGKQFCTFFLDGLCFGVEVEKVQEVIRFQKVTAVPLASSEIAGLINLRGQIVTAIDLRKRLRLKERSDDQLPMNVILRDDQGVVSLLVDEIGDVLETDEQMFEHPPDTLAESARHLIRGVYKLPDRLLVVLDSEKVLNGDNDPQHVN
jgi:purine-binding chemotaxis protein CheW